jgi:hypothetical protein
MYDALVIVQERCSLEDAVFAFFPLVFLVYCLLWQPWRQGGETPSTRIKEVKEEEPILIKSEPVAVCDTTAVTQNASSRAT